MFKKILVEQKLNRNYNLRKKETLSADIIDYEFNNNTNKLIDPIDQIH